jgi:hypothetical protein
MSNDDNPTQEKPEPAGDVRRDEALATLEERLEAARARFDDCEPSFSEKIGVLLFCDEVLCGDPCQLAFAIEALEEGLIMLRARYARRLDAFAEAEPDRLHNPEPGVH